MIPRVEGKVKGTKAMKSIETTELWFHVINNDYDRLSNRLIPHAIAMYLALSRYAVINEPRIVNL